MIKSIPGSAAGHKPRKPRRDFPLFPHATGRWAKKVRGKFAYFGKVADDPKGVAALSVWLDQKDDLLAGRTPRIVGDSLTVRDLCNRFLTVKKNAVYTREITQRHFDDLHTACQLLIDHFGKTRLVDDLAPDDFESLRASLSRTRGGWALGGVVQKIRSVFKYAYESGVIDKPVRFGPTFKRPSKSAIRRERNEMPPRLFTAAELQKLIENADQPMQAMILLAINAGLGNSDCGQLRFRNIDLQNGWLNYPRPKTGAARRCPLWQKTREALQQAIEQRPEPKDEASRDFVFITKYGRPWHQDKTGAGSLGHEFCKLLVELNMRREGLTFYTIRHTFATEAGDSRDQVAVNTIMGHVDSTMAEQYRERIDDARLVAVAEHVRRWLWPSKKRKAK
jgi:integrase